MKSSLYKLPHEFLHRLKKIYPDRYSKIAETFIEKKDTTFRINYLKTDLTSLRKRLNEEKVKFKELPFPKGSFILKSLLRNLQKTQSYIDGLIYVQNISSMIPVLCLGPKEGEKILDLCAAPGAKTTQIASLSPASEITAIEKIRPRYYKLLNSLKQQGADSVNTLLIDGIWVRKKFPEYFDKILLDSPCSGEARFLISNPRSFKYWKMRKVKEMVHKQKKLMHSAFFALKEGGELVYSTCTFSPEENEGIISWFINKFKEKVEITPLEFAMNNARGGLTRWKDKRFPSCVRFCRRILPDRTSQGFFIAKIKKVSS